MSDEVKNQENEHREEVSSTQATVEEQTNDGSKVIEKSVIVEPLPEAPVKPLTQQFKLFSYTGDNDKAKISNWVRLYESLGQRADWSHDDLKWNMASYLEGEAFDFYVEHVLAKELEWTQARQVMLDRFNKYDIEPYMEFLSFKWSPQMELKEYFKKMRALGYDAGIDTKAMLSGLTRGLPVHLRTEMDSVTSLQQWCAVASCLQQRLEESSHYNKHHSNWKGGRRGGNGNANRGTRGQSKRNSHQNPSSEHQNVSAHNGSNHVIEHNEA